MKILFFTTLIATLISKRVNKKDTSKTHEKKKKI